MEDKWLKEEDGMAIVSVTQKPVEKAVWRARQPDAGAKSKKAETEVNK